MILKVITGNGQHKRILPAIERLEAVTTSMQAMVSSTQRATVTDSIRPTGATSIRLAPHFTCSAETLVARVYNTVCKCW